MNRSMLKAQARDRLFKAKPSPVFVGTVFAVILMILSFFSYKLTAEASFDVYLNSLDAEAIQSMTFEEYQEYLQSIDYDAIYRDLEKASPDFFSRLLDYAITVLEVVIGAGMIIFCLNILRGKEASCWNLFDGFELFWKIFLLYIVEVVFISLWAMLFLFPGIIAYYRYSQAIYLLLDNPEKGVMQCIRESSQLMRGHKWERFGLDFSFIGWIILILFGNFMGLAYGAPVMGYLMGIWFFPYYFLTCAGYYRSLTNDDLPNNDGWIPEV